MFFRVLLVRKVGNFNWRYWWGEPSHFTIKDGKLFCSTTQKRHSVLYLRFFYYSEGEALPQRDFSGDEHQKHFWAFYGRRRQQRSSAKKGSKNLAGFSKPKSLFGAFRVGVNPSWELVSASCFDKRERKMKARFLTLQSFDWKLSIFASVAGGHWQFSLVTGVGSSCFSINWHIE